MAASRMNLADVLQFNQDDEQQRLAASLPTELSLLIVDSLQASATFLLTYFVSKTLREGRRCVFVCVNAPKSHYSAVLRRAGVQVPSYEKTGHCAFIDTDHSSADPLTSTLHTLNDALRIQDPVNVKQQPVIIIDDLSALFWLDVHPNRLQSAARFVQHLRSLLYKHNATLISVFHGDCTFLSGPENSVKFTADDDLLRIALRYNDICIQTRSLKSQAIGELSIHRLPALGHKQPSLPVTDRSRAIQYKLEETGPHLWYKGTGAGFL